MRKSSCLRGSWLTFKIVSVFNVDFQFDSFVDRLPWQIGSPLHVPSALQAIVSIGNPDGNANPA